MIDDIGCTCKITVDGTDFRIQEPTPFSLQWFSHKFKSAGLRYEVCINIQNGWIVLVNGPFAAGAWPDIRIAQNKLVFLLASSEFPYEKALADGGYSDGYQFFETPTGEHNANQKMKLEARSRHECVNRRFKTWGILQQTYRGDISMHELCFKSVANITQLIIETCGQDDDEEDAASLFHVEYDDRFGEEDSDVEEE